MILALASALALAGGAAVAMADEVQFKNGDRLTGKIGEVGGGKLVIETEVAGKVSVDLAKVKTFASTRPVEIRMKDGTVINAPVAAAGDGQVAPAGRPAISLGDVKALNPPWRKWAGTLTAGGILTRGNSSTESINVTALVERRDEFDRITLGGSYLYGRERAPGTGVRNTTTDAWNASAKYDYFVSPKLYAYGLGKVERDRIAKLDLRVSPDVGMGYQWVERPDLKFATEAGVGWVYENYAEAEDQDHFVARFAVYRLEKKLADAITLTQTLEYLPSVEDLTDFNVNATTGMRVTLTQTMFTQFLLEWKHDATPAPGAQKNDLRYTVGVGWAF